MQDEPGENGLSRFLKIYEKNPAAKLDMDVVEHKLARCTGREAPTKRPNSATSAQ
jgi:hypothetical protein